MSDTQVVVYDHAPFISILRMNLWRDMAVEVQVQAVYNEGGRMETGSPFGLR